MTQDKHVRGCAVENAPQTFVVAVVENPLDDAGTYFIDEVIGLYTCWAGNRCMMDVINHPHMRTNTGYPIKLDIKGLKALPKNKKYIVRLRAKQYTHIETNKYGRVKTLFGSSLKVYFKYNIFKGKPWIEYDKMIPQGYKNVFG